MMMKGNRGRAVFVAVFTGCCVAAASPAWAGDLDPPPGPVQPTNRTTLHAGNAALPFTISQSGSYALTSDLVGVAGQDGLTIDAPNVTLDLNGFTIRGVAGSGTGLVMTGNADGVTLTNGFVAGWGEDGVRLESGGEMGGVFAAERVHSRQNAEAGWDLGGASVLRACAASGNGDMGFGAGGDGLSTLVDCNAALNGDDAFRGGEGTTFQRCAAYSEEVIGSGFRLDDACVATDCVAQGFGSGFDVDGEGAILRGCAAYDCEFAFQVSDAATLENCTARGGDIGFSLSNEGALARGCIATNVGTIGFLLDGSALECVSFGNQEGFIAGRGARVEGCQAIDNKHGIAAGDDSVIRNNQVMRGSCDDFNIGIGVSGERARVEGNNVSGYCYGLRLESATGAVIVRNSLMGNTVDLEYYGPADYVLGVVISPSMGFTTTDQPWANFAETVNVTNPPAP